MTRPLASSTRLGCTGLKACRGGMGIFFQGWAVGAEVAGFGDAAGLVAVWALASCAVKAMLRSAVNPFKLFKELFTQHLPCSWPTSAALQIRFLRWCGCCRRRSCWLRDGHRLW